MGYVFYDLRITACRLRVVCAGGERRGRREPGALLSHAFHFPLLRFRELGGDDDETQVDHEKRANLDVERERAKMVSFGNEIAN